MTSAPNESPSKSARKRDAQQIRALAEQLVALPQSQREQLLAQSDLLELVSLASRLKRSAAKRQTMLVAKRLRDRPRECAQLQAALESLRSARQENGMKFKRAELWRERLLANDQYTGEQIRRLAGEQAWKELSGMREQYHACRNESKRRALYRRLFRTIRGLLDSGMDEPMDSL